jgi:hypothetical protein
VRAPVPDNWIRTTATVTSCRYRSRALSSVAFGVALGEKYRITFDYFAHGTRYSGEFQSPDPIPQDERIPISYDPFRPDRNTWNHPELAPSQLSRWPIMLLALIAVLMLILIGFALHGIRPR